MFDNTSSMYWYVKLNLNAYSFFPAQSKYCMKSASCEYRNMSACKIISLYQVLFKQFFSVKVWNVADEMSDISQSMCPQYRRFYWWISPKSIGDVEYLLCVHLRPAFNEKKFIWVKLSTDGLTTHEMTTNRKLLITVLLNVWKRSK